jgi:phosphate transport system permease protein
MSEQRTSRPRRRRETRRSVRLAERGAQVLISIGGLGTILFVSLIFVFLVSVVLPLVLGAKLDAPRELAGAAPEGGARPLEVQVDEYGLVAWTYDALGALDILRADTGARLERKVLFEGEAPIAAAFDLETPNVAFGFQNGDVRLGSIDFQSSFVEPDAAPSEARALERGHAIPVGTAVFQRTVEGDLRKQEVSVAIGDPLRAGWQGAIVALDRTELSGGPVVAVLSSEGHLGLLSISRKRNLLNPAKDSLTMREAVVPYTPPQGKDNPDHLLLSGEGDTLYLAWRDGTLQRYDARDRDHIALAEELDLVEEPSAEITALTFLIGKTTLAVGDSLGRLRGWFPVKDEAATAPDGVRLVRAHDIAPIATAAVTALAPSRRSRLIGLGYGDGSLACAYMTSGKIAAEASGTIGGPVVALTLSPKQDALIACSPAGLWRSGLQPRYPEASAAGLLGKQWYETYPEPEYVWQSSGGTDDFEPKLSLVPLVFGTLKATFYSLLFGVPLALLAAIFSSEFLTPRLRVPVKSTIEMMASLPSVVLGFLAGIVLAPFVQSMLPAVLACFASVPLALLAGAYFWQLLPGRLAVRWGGWPRLFAILGMLPVGALAALWLGPAVEDLLFAGDTELWLDGRIGSPIGGWVFLLLPICLVLVIGAAGSWGAAALRRRSAGWSRAVSARFDLARFLIGGLLTVGLALLLALVLTKLGLDPRGGVIGTYAQRNALVVGFVMGFAIIPIIYTVAEDALSSVPSHLREASLGAGATTWQTALRVVVPTAMSGLFSAVMIGLGRAVGETMIVLMATGNTPVMEWNVFSGFRTLAANIAFEMPEAVQGDAHYRILFLAALVLFAMTFAVNTCAEMVRQRFRKRAFQL